MEIKIKGIRDGGSGEDVDIKASRHGSVLASQYLPYGALLTAKGESWSVMATVAVAGLVVRPSTLAMVTLYNGEAPGGKSYIIERAFTHNLVATAAQGFFGIWLVTHHVGTAACGVDIAVQGSLRAIANYGGNAQFGIEEAVHADGWFPWGPSVEGTAAAKPGAIACVEVNGRIIIPPSAMISLQVVTDTIGSTFCSGFQWYETIIDLAS